MAARQFGFVIARALAVYCFTVGLNHLYLFGLQTFGSDPYYRNLMFPATERFMNVGVLAIYLLLAAFLWTSADKFAGPQADGQPSLRAGNWMVRLAFTSLGLLVIMGAITGVVSGIVQIGWPDPMRPPTRAFYVDVVVGSIKCLLGLGLILAYRFDKAAALEAAQSIKP